MAVKQVKDTEECARKFIEKNEVVYAMDAALAEAKAVQGLRAVFEETYPDPVRIVSIGVPVRDLLDDPNGSAGSSTSVEFCGGTHLHRSGHVGQFVITSEEAIAKGIRRIIALTGPEADRAVTKAKRLSDSVEKLNERIKSSGIKNDRLMQKAVATEIVQLTEEISQASIAYWKKDKLRNDLKAFKKVIDEYDKVFKQEIAQRILDEAKEMSENNDGCILVHEFPPGGNSKALDSALKQLKSPASMVFSVDPDAGKVLCLAYVGKEYVTKGLSAKEWIGKVCEVIGGKGGGKETNAQATGDSMERVKEAISVARQFADMKVGS